MAPSTPFRWAADQNRRSDYYDEHAQAPGPRDTITGFPRAGAIVTDVGAPLSHAAIVAREPGIPAVVGCGNATMRVHAGDPVRVDGGHGTVEVLHRA